VIATRSGCLGLSDDPDCPGVSVDGQLFIEPPTTREIAEALQLQTRPNRDSYDVVIVGAGPAGMAAGVYGSSEGLSVLIVERCACRRASRHIIAYRKLSRLSRGNFRRRSDRARIQAGDSLRRGSCADAFR
jgi:hypothetical protein